MNKRELLRRRAERIRQSARANDSHPLFAELYRLMAGDEPFAQVVLTNFSGDHAVTRIRIGNNSETRPILYSMSKSSTVGMPTSAIFVAELPIDEEFELKVPKHTVYGFLCAYGGELAQTIQIVGDELEVTVDTRLLPPEDVSFTHVTFRNSQLSLTVTEDKDPPPPHRMASWQGEPEIFFVNHAKFLSPLSDG